MMAGQEEDCTGRLNGDRRSSRSKVVSLTALAGIVEAARSKGRVVALAHGVFDLLHLGHVRHLEEARSHGDMLVVTVTADRFVNKGPGRPVFSEQLRAQMLAALEYVDYVAINEAPTAVAVLEKVRPSVYVKGSDYANAAEDITGGIIEERRAVEEHGGRLVFTDDITFSSSQLINRYLGVYDSELQAYLEDARDGGLLPRLLELLERIKDYKVLLVGDAIIDEYRYVAPMAKAPKENIIATLYRDHEVFAGGIAAAANHVAAFCRQVDFVTCLGERNGEEALIRASLKPNVTMRTLSRKGKPTTRKTRFVDPGYMRKLFEVYDMDDAPLDAEEETALLSMLENAGDYDLVIVTDFGHGMMTEAVIKSLCDKARFLAVNTQTNSANLGFNLITRYPRADYVCIDAPEARLAVGDKYTDIAIIAGDTLPNRLRCPRLIITHGKYGCITRDQATGTSSIPAFTNTVVDTVGAGDAFLAVTSPLAATGGDLGMIGFLGNAAGAMKVGIVGHRSSIEKTPLIKFITAILK
jgi:rfaE bifunctional protein nucleotidyltransferase chain/domain